MSSGIDIPRAEAKRSSVGQLGAVITFKVDDILETTKQNTESNKRGKLYSGYDTMCRMMLELLVDVSEDAAQESIRAEG